MSEERWYVSSTPPRDPRKCRTVHGNLRCRLAKGATLVVAPELSTFNHSKCVHCGDMGGVRVGKTKENPRYNVVSVRLSDAELATLERMRGKENRQDFVRRGITELIDRMGRGAQP